MRKWYIRNSVSIDRKAFAHALQILGHLWVRQLTMVCVGNMALHLVAAI